jgi:signal transduction histidine kinase/CheY-like chemotaxis protein
MPIRDPGGQILGTFGIYTRRPAAPTPEHLQLMEVASHLAGLAIAQEESKRTLEERARALVEADRRKDEFLAMLAHELRNPLAAIMTALELMQQGDRAPAQQARTRDVVGRQACQLVHLVDDLLDVSRFTHGKIQLSRAACDVRELVHRAIESTRTLIDGRRHRLTVTAPDEPLQVLGDFSRLVQVLSNIIGNAAKYTAAGGAIEIGWCKEGRDVLIEVGDTGAGMSPELLSQVFEPFVQADRTLNRAGGGLGLGLTLVRSIVELHAGQVVASSPGPGLGSVFTVRLPTLDPRAVPLTPPLATDAAADPARAGIRVLVVDDNTDAAELLADALRGRGYEVRTASDGTLALRVVAQWDPQVVVLDIGLPGLDGYTVARELRRSEVRPERRLIALTGYGQPSDRNRAKEAGFDALLLKPASLKAVFEAVSRFKAPPQGAQ